MSATSASEYREDLTPEGFAARTAFLATAEGGGATILGGCCGVFPEHIEALAERVSR